MSPMSFVQNGGQSRMENEGLGIRKPFSIENIVTDETYMAQKSALGAVHRDLIIRINNFGVTRKVRV